MSTYKPHMPMPLDMLEYQQKIKEFSGLHMSFPYGTILPKEGASKFETFIPHVMQFEGSTIRGFFYIPESSDITSHFDLYCEFDWAVNVAQAEVYIEKTFVKYRTIINYKLRQANHEYVKGLTVPVPGYYSVAVRFENQKEISIYYGDQRINIENQGVIIHYNWLFRMWGRVHFLVSLHFSAEKNQLPRESRQRYYVDYPEFGIGSYWLIEGVVTGTNKPLTVQLRDGGEAKFPLRTVKQQDVVTIHIRSTRGGYLVSTSFDDETKFITTAENSKNFIYPEFSDNFEIYRQFAEQGTERYQ